MSCSDCGGAPVNHFVEKMNAAITEMTAPISFSLTSFISGLPRRSFEPFAPALFRLIATLRLGTIVRDPDTKTGGRALCVWLEAKRRGINMWEFRPFGLSREMFVAEIPAEGKNRKKFSKTISKTIVFNGLPRPAATLSGKKGQPASLAWVDHKVILKKKLAEAGIPVARGDTTCTWKRAWEIFGLLNKPVVVKPSTGSRSRHTTTNISDEPELRRAFTQAKKLSPRIIIEEELAGQVYRGTVIGGNVIGIRRKDPPHVTGDGLHNLRELIEAENKRPERQGPMYGKIKIGGADFELEKNMALTTIPRKGVTVILSKKTSIGSGGGSTDVTDLAHPDIIAVLEKIAVVLDDPLVGADFILRDITRPFAEQPPSGVIECNSLPFINVHMFPLEGKSLDTAGTLWDVVLQ